MIEVLTSRSGSPFIRIDGVALHSPYDPQREAQRFGQNALGQERPSTIVILGEGLGYLSRWSRSVHPSARVLRVFYSTEIFRCASQAPPATDQDTWHPGLGTSIGEFLRTRIGDLDIEGLRILEWPPSSRLFPELCSAANEALHQVLLEINGTLVTTMSSGRLWLRNCVANFLALDGVLQGAPCSPKRTVVVAAPGPSLEQAAPLLQEIRDSVDIWALASSAPFLAHAGLIPDLFFMTDPGFYAISHFHRAPPACPVAMPLSAARGLWELASRRAGSPLPTPFLLSQPGILEETFLHALGVAAPMVAPHGTVAATALDLALSFTGGPVIVAGLDMCTNDIISHARPNEFERFFHLRSARTAPYDGLWYRRSADQNATRIPGGNGARAPLSLRTYAGWLGRGNTRAGGRVFRLLPSAVALPEMATLDAAALKELVKDSPSPLHGGLLRHTALPTRAQRVSMISKIIGDWRESLAAATRSARGPDGLGVLATSPIFDLSCQLAAQRLLETRRAARLGDESKARQSAVDLLEDCERFLHGLEKRVLDAV